jgi:PQQ-dependent dehydrogenase (s-GDH family)
MKKILLTILLINFLQNAFPQCVGTGSINFQRWNNISGTSISNLTSNSRYPNNPNSSGTRTSFEMPNNISDNIGIKMYGYICPPTSGAYVFWIASDDAGELWLSTTNSSSQKVKIAFHTGYTGSQEWNKYLTQKSATINLLAGQKYYVEALMKEGTGGDNLAVGWAKPGQATTSPSQIIPGSNLSTNNTVAADTQAPTAPTNLAATSITTSSFTLGWTASTDNFGVAGYDIYRNGTKINSSTVTTSTYALTGLVANTNYSMVVRSKDAAGNFTNSSTLVVKTLATGDTQAPTAPTNLGFTNVTSTSFTLKWSVSTDNVAVTGYDIYNGNTKINTATMIGTSFSVTGLLPNSAYAITVRAKDAAGNTSTSAVLNLSTIIPTSGTESFTMRTILANQRMPHDLVVAPDGNIWFTERFAGTVSFVNPTTNIKKVVLTLGSNMVRVGGQDGLMGLALHPQFATGLPFVYISYTYNSTSATVRKTRIQKYTYDAGTQTLINPETVLENIPGSNDHNSSRIAIGPDLKLYYSVGDMGAGQYDNASRANNSQNLSVNEGKILRLNTESIAGSWIPTDNPFTNAGVPTPVYTYGHRNPQGLVWGNVNGVNILYSTEHGPFSDDEVNTIEVGRNYGWPNVVGYCDGNYNGITAGGYTIVNEQTNCSTLNAKEPMRTLFPATYPPTGGNNMLWPSVAPSGTDFYSSSAIPGWQNSLLVATLKAGTIIRYKLSSDGQTIVSDSINYFKGKGRFRDIAVSADGLKLYVACDSSGSTSGPTGGVTSTPANPGSILEFTYNPPTTMAASSSSRLSAEKDMYLYPNPANDYLIIDNNNEKSERLASIIDMSGKSLRSKSINGQAIKMDVKDLQEGIYILNISDNKGKIVKSEKFLIIH